MIRRDIQKDTIGAAARPSGLPIALKLDHVKILKINVVLTQSRKQHTCRSHSQWQSVIISLSENDRPTSLSYTSLCIIAHHLATPTAFGGSADKYK
jgi:hypothetical protein